MRLSRTRLVALLAFLTLAVLLGSWFHTGWQSARSEALALRQQPLSDARHQLGELAIELASRLDSLRAKEDARPYYHYQNLFHDPRGLSEGKSVSPSPLVEETGDPLISVHFQIDLAGKLSIPPINEEIAQFSQQDSLPGNLKKLEDLRAAQTRLTGEAVLVARLEEASPETPRETQQAQGMPQAQVQKVQQQKFTQQAFVQNVAPNAVFQELEQHGKKTGSAPAGGPELVSDPLKLVFDREVSLCSGMACEGSLPRQVTDQATKSAGKASTPRGRAGERGKSMSLNQTLDKPIEVSTHSFVWRSAEIGDTTELVGVRRIQTPEGDINQGFVVGSTELQAWLKSRGGDFPDVSLARGIGDEEDQRSIAVPALDGWQLRVDTSFAETLAANKADALGSGFLWRFLPSAAVSLLLCVMMVLAVARAEEIAKERSQFAAAAAHELRTPLAGLQLYGDMLAEGLGDQSAKEKYARHIADEAQRLGRVVSNVLGFSQMERNGINLHVCEGNLASAVQQVVERMRPALEETGMQIETQIPEELHAVFDDDALSRILQNLMDNAEKYSREHDDRRLRIAVEEAEGVASVSISDGGPGVVRQWHQQIFKPFKRNADADGPAGLGLGLALAQSLAKQQGGDLRIQDSPFGGASFVLELPQTV